MGKLRIGIVGCGRISVMYQQAFKALEDQIEVVYACDKIQERALKFASNYPSCTATTSFEELLDSGVDIIHILTPHFLHGEMAIKAMERKINVLTEKPMDISMCKAAEMIRVSEEMDVTLGVIFQTRYMKAAQEMKRIVDQGHLGKVTGAWSTMHWSRSSSYYQCNWKGFWDKEGGGVLIDQAIHSIDLVQWIVGGQVDWIKGSMDNRILTMIEVEDVADAVISFKEGFLYSLYACNYFSKNDPIQICITGEKGNMHLIKDTVTITLEGQEPYIVSEGEQNQKSHGLDYWGNHHTIQIKNFYESISEGRRPDIDGYNGIRALQIVLQTYESARQGKPVYSSDFLDGIKF